MPEPTPAPRAKRGKKRREPTPPPDPERRLKSRAAIIPSGSVHHCTPSMVLDTIVYPVLGRPVDLDPCSNADSIVESHHRIVFDPGHAARLGVRPRDALAFPWDRKFAQAGRTRFTIFCNFPFGVTPEEWLKQIAEAHYVYGAEVIAVFPANISSEWFNSAVATAHALFFWGPSPFGTRVKYIGNENNATFTTTLGYWGNRLDAMTRAAIPHCHPWYVQRDMQLARAYAGDLLALAEGPGRATLSSVLADRLLVETASDDIATALISLGTSPLQVVLDCAGSELLGRLGQLPSYHVGVALLLATRSALRSAPAVTKPRTPSVPDPRQLGLLDRPQVALAAATSPPKADPTPGERAEAVYEYIRQCCEGGSGPSSRQIAEDLGYSANEVRGAIRRLRKSGRIVPQGKTRATRFVVQEPPTPNEGTENART